MFRDNFYDNIRIPPQIRTSIKRLNQNLRATLEDLDRFNSIGSSTDKSIFRPFLYDTFSSKGRTRNGRTRNTQIGVSNPNSPFFNGPNSGGRFNSIF
ncbi:MAG: hypothetical protein K2X66_08470 [Cyanobacteria bacterium]|nr:hypothetical protein [Cyanobacteriota bacterium]